MDPSFDTTLLTNGVHTVNIRDNAFKLGGTAIL